MPVRALADVELGSSRAVITRENGKRYVGIRMNVRNRDLARDRQRDPAPDRDGRRQRHDLGRAAHADRPPGQLLLGRRGADLARPALARSSEQIEIGRDFG